MRLPTVTAVVSKNTNRVSLIQGNDYYLVGMDDEYYHVIDEGGVPVLYPKDYFIDEEVECPSDWYREVFDDAEYYCYPREFSTSGFFEDLDAGCSYAVEVFKRFLRDRA